MLDNTASNRIYNSQWLNSSSVVNCCESHTQCGLATCSALHHLYCLYLSHKISQTRHKLLMLLFISAWSIYPLVLRESQLQRMRVWDNFSPLGKLSTWHGCIFESRFPDGRQLEPVRHTSFFLFHNCALSTASANKFSQFFITQGFLSFFSPFQQPVWGTHFQAEAEERHDRRCLV